MTIQANANAGQETWYNDKGALPESQYDVFCLGFPSHDERPNYYAARCAERLAAGSCLHGGCKRYKGKPPKNRQLTGEQRNIRAKQKPSNRVRLCVCGCGETGFVVGRGLIRKCHARMAYQGRLDEFKKQRKLGATVKK